MEHTYNQTINKSFIKYFLGSTCMYLFYLTAVQIGYAVYQAVFAVKDGAGYQVPAGADIVYLAAMWLPFFILLFVLIRKYRFSFFLTCSRDAFRKHWFKFGIYFLFLYAIRQNMWIGNYYIELPSGGVQLDSSFGSVVAMLFVHFMAETISTVILFTIIPFLCYVSCKMKASPKENFLPY